MKTEEINVGFCWSRKSPKPCKQVYILSDETIKWVKNGKVQFEYPWDMLTKIDYSTITFHDKKKYSILFRNGRLFEKIISHWGILYPDKCVENLYKLLKYGKFVSITLAIFTTFSYVVCHLGGKPVDIYFTIVTLITYPLFYGIYYQLKKNLMKLISAIHSSENIKSFIWINHS